MKKFVVLFLFFITSLTVFAQKNIKKVKKEKEPTIFLTGIINQQINDLKIGEDWIFEHFYKDTTIHKKHSSMGAIIGIGFKVGKVSDLIFNISFQKNILNQTFDFPFTACNPKDYNAKTIVNKTRQVSLTTLSIPIEYRYKIVNKHKFSLYSSVGFSLSFALNKKQSVDILLDNGVVAQHKNNEVNLDVDNPVNFAPFAKIGFRYHLLKPLYLKVEPFYTYHIGKERFLTETKNSNLFAYGVNVGVEYILKK